MPAGRPLALVPGACTVRGDGSRSVSWIVSGLRSMMREPRPAGAYSASPDGADPVPGTSPPRSMRCRSVVASVSLPARVRRVASSMSACSMSFMSGAFWVCLAEVRPREAAGPSRSREGGGGVSGGGAVGSSQVVPGHLIRSARAALTAELARRAPSTTIDPIVARASSGVTSWAMLARPSTWMWSVWPAARTASRSSRL